MLTLPLPLKPNRTTKPVTDHILQYNMKTIRTLCLIIVFLMKVK